MTAGLCGFIEYEGYYRSDVSGNNYQLLNANSAGPVKYNAATRTFTFDSDDHTLIGKTRSVQVRAKLTDYPSLITETDTFTVTYGNKCLDPVSFDDTAQTDVTFTYDGSNIFTLTPFSINPAECPIKYDISSVERKDGSTFTGDLSRSDFTNY